jgi:Family of unknown function (DUF5709)
VQEQGLHADAQVLVIAVRSGPGVTGAELMPDDRRHESADLGDYEVLDGTDTLNGAPGDDPLDRGVVTPQHWSAAIRYGPEESLDLLLAAEEPDIGRDDDGRPDHTGWDENATEEDIARLSLEQGPEPRAGRLAAEDEVVYDADEAYLIGHDDRLARDESIDGCGASAEEMAIHYRIDES